MVTDSSTGNRKCRNKTLLTGSNIGNNGYLKTRL